MTTARRLALAWAACHLIAGLWFAALSFSGDEPHVGLLALTVLAWTSGLGALVTAVLWGARNKD